MQRREYVLAASAFAVFFVALFSPVLFGNLLLGPGDGTQYWAFFRRGFLLWNERILSGFPAFADPQQLTWYPLRWLVPDFNLFVVSAYVVAATGAYVLARVYRAHPVAAAAGALAYASSGFMIAHLGHTTMIHAAAWLPWIMAAIEKNAGTGSSGWLAIGAIAIGLALLGGHPQVVVYGLGVGAALMAVNVFARVRRDAKGASGLAISYAAMLVLGVALSAIQIIPSSQLATQTERALPTFEFFVTYSLPLRQMGEFFFPFSWGPWGKNTPVYFGEWNFVELANYVGISTLVFIAAGFGRITDAKKYLWLAAAVGAFFFTLGPATPAARLAFELPLVQSFRVPGRAAIVIMLAASVLLAMALSSLGSSRSKRTFPLLAGVVPLIAAAAAAIVFLPAVRAAAVVAKTATVSLLHETYVVPMLAGVAAVGIVAFVVQARVFAVAALVLVSAELSWWAVNVEWRWWSPPVPILGAELASLRDRANALGGRIAPIEGPFKGPSALHPNISSVFGISSTSGYGPLLPTKYRDVSGLSPSGDSALGSLNTSIFQAMGVSHVVYAPATSGEIAFARGCGGASNPSASIQLLAPAKATHVRIRSNMGCSPQIAQGAPVLRIRSTGLVAMPERMLRAGIDTAEWAIRRDDVAPIARHREPPQSVDLPNTNGIGRIFVSDIPLLVSGASTTVSRLDFDLLADGVSLHVYSVELVDTTTGLITAPPPAFPAGMRPDDFEKEGAIGELVAARFKRFLGRAWLVPTSFHVSPEQSLAALKTEHAPDGSPLDLARMVLLDTPAPSTTAPSSGGGSVLSMRLKENELRFEVETPSPQFLVIAQQFYPGWRATVNGMPKTIYRANHAFQSVVAPAGKSVIELRFEPPILQSSAAISLVAAIILAALTFGGALWRSALSALALTIRRL